ncbi:MAG: sigma 54-interacting transcriptional regulator [Planctomycetaceae bacterium]|nr:sigma 54-interacting transcriptional regulator [Planctomycetaceae bacterium]
MTRPIHLFGILGSQLDMGKREDRWGRWRPTVAACQHEDLLIERFDLVYESRTESLAKTVQADIRSVSPETDVVLHELNFTDPWDFEEVFSTLHQFARGYQFDTEKNDYLIHITTGSHVQQICLFLLTESRHFPGRLLQTSPRKADAEQAGSFRIIDLDLSRYDALAARFAEEKLEGLTFLKSGIETRNAAFNRLIEHIERVAISSRAPMLVTGPTGAGKTRLARRIYELRRRREQISGDFVELNCATLRGDQAMSTLFGHVKGAFTGALNARPGLLVSADRGLLFLDEIGELGLDEQAMLLRALEERRFLPVGADREVQSDFQLIAGTNRDLSQAVAEGRFREDLLARINLWTFRLPGLAERREDIEPNLDYELQRISDATGHRISMSKEARTAFLKWAESSAAHWSGNFRDLNAAVVRMATLAHAGRISVSDVHEEIERLTEQSSRSIGKSSCSVSDLLGEAEWNRMDLFDQLQLTSVIQVCRESKSLSDAGRRLFSVSRTTRSSTNDADRLRKFLSRFGLSWQRVVEQPPEAF